MLQTQTQIQVHLASPTVTVKTVKSNSSSASVSTSASVSASAKERLMHWYTLSPADILTFQDIKSGIYKEQTSIIGEFPPNGHSIAAALRELLRENAIIAIHGPFLCHAETLYFSRPYHYHTLRPHLPLIWLQEDTATSTDRPQQMLWDRRKPVPLMPQSNSGLIDQAVLDASMNGQCDRAFLSSDTILKLLKNTPPTSEELLCAAGESPYPWMTEIRSQGTAQAVHIEQTIRFAAGWKFAIAVDDATHYKLQRLGNTLPIRLGQAAHPFRLELADETLKQQWHTIQQYSQQNFRAAQTGDPTSEAARVLAYLITPGLFERKHAGAATCRAFPWEWNLAHPIDDHQPAGALVSLAAPAPMPINCRSLSKASSGEDVSTVQVFAAPAGSVYFLEYPVPLFQDQPFLKDGRLNKVHIWRKLGYSELLWLPCPRRA